MQSPRRARPSFAHVPPLIDGAIAPLAASLAPRRRRKVSGFRIDARILAVEAGQQDAFVADIQDAFAPALEPRPVLLVEPSGPLGPQAAVVPDQVDRVAAYHVLARQQAHHHGHALAVHADARHRDLGARRRLGAPEHAAGYEREEDRGGLAPGRLTGLL
jgi:hypothetical protein